MYSVCLLSLRAIFMSLCCVLFLPCNLCVVLFLCLIICNDPQLWTHAVYTLFVCPLRRFLLISRTSCAATQDLVKGWMKRVVSLVLSTRQKRLKQRLWFPTPKTLKTVFLFLRQQFLENELNNNKSNRVLCLADHKSNIVRCFRDGPW